MSSTAIIMNSPYLALHKEFIAGGLHVQLFIFLYHEFMPRVSEFIPDRTPQDNFCPWNSFSVLRPLGSQIRTSRFAVLFYAHWA